MQTMRIKVRNCSLAFRKGSNNTKDFDLKMSKNLYKLKQVTQIYHYVRAIKRNIGVLTTPHFLQLWL